MLEKSVYGKLLNRGQGSIEVSTGSVLQIFSPTAKGIKYYFKNRGVVKPILTSFKHWCTSIMHFRVKLKKPALLLSLSLVMFTNVALGFERLNVGDTVFVACENIFIHTKPSVFSEKIKTLKFGESLNVTGLKKLFTLPASDASSKETLEREEEDSAEQEEREIRPVPPESYTRASWLQFANGYSPASCFVTKQLMKTQTPEKVKQRVNALSASQAKRNFSEDEKGDMTAMRGVAGKAKGARANYEKVDNLIEENQKNLDIEKFQVFRKNGRLGEFR